MLLRKYISVQNLSKVMFVNTCAHWKFVNEEIKEIINFEKERLLGKYLLLIPSPFLAICGQLVSI